MAVLAVLAGAITLRIIEKRLVGATGESLALAASDIADDLDRMLFERDGDIHMLAQAAVFQGSNHAAMSAYLAEVRRNYRVYLRLAVTDRNGRIVAATNPDSIGQDRSGREWFHAVRASGAIHVQDAEASEDTGGVVAVAFTTPITDVGGEFRGAVTAWVSLPVLEEAFEDTVHALQVQRGAAGTIEWQFLTRDGDVIADSILHQEGKGANLRRMGLPSALLIGSAQPGYVEEQHLRRRVAVVSGYAQTRGFGGFPGFHWGVLVRVDRSDILAPIRSFQWKLGLVGALVVLPLLAVLLWTSRRLRVEWLQAQAESARATAAEATIRESEERLREAQKLEAVGQLAGGIAHEFNNLLTGILGNLALVRLELGSTSSVSPMVTMAERSARRAADLIRQLLSVGLRTPGLPYALDLGVVVEEVSQFLRGTLDPRIVIEAVLPGDRWAVSGDAGQIHQVLMNLCLNARDAMPQGGRLTISLENHSKPDRPGEGFVRVVVADTGEGMDADTCRRIFEPFFTTKDVGQGTGLGLAVAYGIVKQHGGTIAVESVPGHGSRFILEFPRATQAGKVSLESVFDP
jgi:signal transduction histidine kinase